VNRGDESPHAGTPSRQQQPRWLHVATLPDGGIDQILAYRAMAIAEPGRHELLVIGGPAGSVRAMLATMGVSATVITPMLGSIFAGRHALGAIGGVRRFLNEQPRGRLAGIVCWSLAGRDVLRRVVGPAVTVACIAAIGPRADADLAADVDGALAPVAPLWARGAAQPAPIPLPGAWALLPSDVTGAWSAQRSRLRATLGLGDDELGVLMLADPADRASTRRMCSRVGVLMLGGVTSSLIVPACSVTPSKHMRRGVRHTARHQHAWDLLASDWPAISLLPAADLVLWADAEPLTPHSTTPHRAIGGSLTARAAMLAGVPVVATDGPVTRAVLSGHVADAQALARSERLPAWGAMLMGVCGGEDRGQATAPSVRRAALAELGRRQRVIAQQEHGDFVGAVAQIVDRAAMRAFAAGERLAPPGTLRRVAERGDVLDERGNLVEAAR
jgi:hypothetical protein